jgi:hypothetical protein
MLEEIIKEKTSADHLLYVSLKYTKTCDVILNLIERWRSLIDLGFDAIIANAIKEKRIKIMHNSPKQKIEHIREYFKKDKEIQDILPLYIFFRRIPGLPKSREGEFRKNVNLKIIEENKETDINLDKLKEYSQTLEKFISAVRHKLSIKK